MTVRVARCFGEGGNSALRWSEPCTHWWTNSRVFSKCYPPLDQAIQPGGVVEFQVPDFGEMPGNLISRRALRQQVIPPSLMTNSTSPVISISAPKDSSSSR
ncbi:hypothetical protein F4555_000270 [Mobiluncus mulieris]|uniref:hypothetical protein n=1 Tax=Mobiluncus mulieris TaxID=2052 RepID=UPI0017BE0A48|nr:hypothetical protein [Mobiluncus mulieris]MBB5845474.1 hypothetical protein [Mobiluncus mulieris]